jgi:hypothetical protein
MSESDQFRQYAEEALLWAAQSKNRRREAASAGAGVHLDSSSSRKRGDRCRTDNSRTEQGHRFRGWREKASAARRGGGSPRPARHLQPTGR